MDFVKHTEADEAKRRKACDMITTQASELDSHDVFRILALFPEPDSAAIIEKWLDEFHEADAARHRRQQAS